VAPADAQEQAAADIAVAAQVARVVARAADIAVAAQVARVVARAADIAVAKVAVAKVGLVKVAVIQTIVLVTTTTVAATSKELWGVLAGWQKCRRAGADSRSARWRS